MARITPPLYARGLFTVASPWTITADKIYVCRAIRGFRDLYEQDKDVFEVFYKPQGFASEQDAKNAFESDRKANAAIITLIAEDDSEVVYIPDTYIETYPGMDDVKYSHMVLSVSLGALPDKLDLLATKDQIKNKVGALLGVEPDVKEHRVPHDKAITADEHATLESSRQGAITLNQTTDARIKELETQNAALQNEVDSLRQILEDEGYAQS